MSKLKFIDKWNKFCQIPEYHYLCDRISDMSDCGLGCPRLEKGYLVRIALFFFYFLGITLSPITFSPSRNRLSLIISKEKFTSSGSRIWRVTGYAIRSAI